MRRGACPAVSCLLALLALPGLAGALAAQVGTPYLLADAAPARSSDPRDFTRVGSLVFFTADDGGAATGRELYVSDGTAAGTRLVKDIVPGPAGSSPSGLTAVGDRLYFVLEGLLEHHGQLWASDGTASGTAVVKDFGPSSVAPYELTEAGGLLFFLRGLLWVSDGTEGGTRPLHEVVGQPATWAYDVPVRLGDRFYLRAGDPEHGGELWVSDLTPGGTQLLVDIQPGPASSNPRALAVVGDQLYFWADDGGGEGEEHWVSDGTAAGTRRLRDALGRVAPWTWLQRPVVAGAQLFFVAADEAHGEELWVADSSFAGARLVADLHPGPEGSGLVGLTARGGRVLLVVSPSESEQALWVSDGTQGGTNAVLDLHPLVEGLPTERLELRPLGDTQLLLKLPARGGTWQLWLSDGSPAGTRLLRDLGPDNFFWGPALGVGPHLHVCVAADDGVQGREPWQIDVASDSADPLADINAAGHSDSSFPRFQVAGPLAFLIGSGPWLDSRIPRGTWVTDGTPEGAGRLAGLEVADAHFAAGRVFLVAEGGLWTMERVSDEPRPVVRDLPGGIDRLTAFAERLYFTALADGAARLWASDGTAEGTAEVPGAPPRVASVEVIADRLLVRTEGCDLWLDDASGSGLVQVASDVHPQSRMATLNDKLYFITCNGALGAIDLVTGEQDPEEMLDLRIDPYGAQLTPMGDQLFLVAQREGFEGQALWRLTPGAESYTVGAVVTVEAPFIQALTVVGGRLAFAAVWPPRLWVSDGWSAEPVEGVEVGPSGGPRFLAGVGEAAYFHNACGLWRSDGTAAGTHLLDLGETRLALVDWGQLRRVGAAPGAAALEPCRAGAWSVVNPPVLWPEKRLLLFSGDDGQSGAEPWALPLGPAPGPRFRRGDTNGDATIDMSDAIAGLGHLFIGQPPSLACARAADANDSGRVDISDAVYTLSYLFLGAPAPPAPFPECGEDPTPDGGPSCEAPSCP